MSDSTDSFIALSVILAFKTNQIVDIIGIENQKIKECDRPWWVCELLNSLGVLSYEVP